MGRISKPSFKEKVGYGKLLLANERAHSILPKFIRFDRKSVMNEFQRVRAQPATEQKNRADLSSTSQTATFLRSPVTSSRPSVFQT